MRAYRQNLLARHANKRSFVLPPVVAFVLRSADDLAWAAGAHATTIKIAMTARIQMLKRFFAYGTLAGGLWTSLALGEIPTRAPRDVSRAIEPVRMSIDEHWRRAAGILSAAIASCQRVKAFQAAAARQLDSADYALTQLIHDLRAAMPLPADVSALRAILAEAERTAPQRQRQALAA